MEQAAQENTGILRHTYRKIHPVLSSSPNLDVRISPSTGQLLAASIPQLIAQITSPKLLDYDLLSDFFLTYRLFMTPLDLASQLVERLHDAIKASDEFSRIVRVRTFVALRHWILNYFVDDFVTNLELRSRFCILVNNLCRGLENETPERTGDLRILAELKKCWRHTCALFWDVPIQPDPQNPNEDIIPGGHVGSRAAPSEWDDMNLGAADSLPEIPSESSGRVTSLQTGYPIPEFAFNQTSKLGSMTISSASSLSAMLPDERQSIHVLSCSIPASFFPGSKHQRDPSFGPRPVPAIGGLQKKQSKPSSQPPSATENPRKHHSRSGSFSDALRDDRAPLPTPKDERTQSDREEQPAMPIMIPGSLIRGAIVSPSTPYVETVLPTSPVEDGVSFGWHGSQSDRTAESRGRQAQPANPGMRRFIGSVRRALSAKNTGRRTYSPSPRRTSPERLANSPFRRPSRREPSAQKRKLVGGRAALRIDLLAAEVDEAFKTAVQEVRAMQEILPYQNTMQMVDADQELPSVPTLQIPRHIAKGSSVTTGSRSIVIMDDTNGQVTPRPDLKPPSQSFGQGHSQFSSFQPGHEGVQSVPVFLDPNPSESVEIQSEINADTEHSYVHISTDQYAGHTSNSARQHVESFAESDLLPCEEASPEDDVDFPNPSEETKPQILSFDAPTTATDDTQTSTNDPFHLDRAPTRQLRRLPGGNLRTANHVHSLDVAPTISSSNATGSLLQRPTIPPRTSSQHATGMQQDSTTKEDTALHSGLRTSQPPMRPSFEREVAKLAQLPDTADGDNGIESALRRLEGRGESLAGEPPPEFLASIAAAQSKGRESMVEPMSTKKPELDERIKRQHREDEVVELDPALSHAEAQGWRQEPHVIVQHKPISLAESSTTQSSIPLLERGASHPPKPRANPAIVVEPVSQTGSWERSELNHDSQQTTAAASAPPGSEDSYDFVGEDESLRQARAGKKPMLPTRAHQSFLLNDNESLSELSSLTPDDISIRDAQGPLPSPGMHSFFEDGVDSGRNTPRQSKQDTRDPSSRTPLPLERPGNPCLSSPTDDFQVDPAYVPGSRPVTRGSMTVHQQHGIPKSVEDLVNAHARQAPLTQSPAATHLPFILAYDSLVLAQQLTIIERDALCEIDWRDLIDLRWNQTATAYYNWVEYLRSTSGQSPHSHGPFFRPGVDMCIARFNLVVRWVKSEVILTQDVHERAATVVKFIHIAQHARRLRNWATMYQVAMALVSADLSRLKQTWAIVPQEEKMTLENLEELIMPKRNFHNLRLEVETATSTWAEGGEGGCIPFIGVYTHDLIYNAQKPTKVRATRRGHLEDASDPEEYSVMERSVLINFERHHTAAMIVKNLLRLIEASSKYTFQPDPEVSSRCLWLGAIHDAEVTRRSKELEPVERSSA